MKENLKNLSHWKKHSFTKILIFQLKKKVKFLAKKFLYFPKRIFKVFPTSRDVPRSSVMSFSRFKKIHPFPENLGLFLIPRSKFVSFSILVIIDASNAVSLFALWWNRMEIGCYLKNSESNAKQEEDKEKKKGCMCVCVHVCVCFSFSQGLMQFHASLTFCFHDWFLSSTLPEDRASRYQAVKSPARRGRPCKGKIGSDISRTLTVSKKILSSERRDGLFLYVSLSVRPVVCIQWKIGLSLWY